MGRGVIILTVIMAGVLLGGGIWLYSPDLPRAALERRHRKSADPRHYATART
jgi:hypothetical protein